MFWKHLPSKKKKFNKQDPNSQITINNTLTFHQATEGQSSGKNSHPASEEAMLDWMVDTKTPGADLGDWLKVDCPWGPEF